MSLYEDYKRHVLCISVPEVGLLLNTCPVHFLNTVNFIHGHVSQTIILAFIEPFIYFRHLAFIIYVHYLLILHCNPFVGGLIPFFK